MSAKTAKPPFDEQYVTAVEQLREKLETLTALLDFAPCPNTATWADLGSVNHASELVGNAIYHISGE